MKRDIILIGMPGAGKSTLGKELAEALHRPFLDLDAVIEQKSGRSISDIFQKDGEEAFRKIETEIFQNTIGFGGVLATGGGIVVKPENFSLARQGTVLFLDRPLDEILKDIDVEKRPLLKERKEKLSELYNDRYLLYYAWANLQILNQGRKEEVIEKMINEVKNYENHGN